MNSSISLMHLKPYKDVNMTDCAQDVKTKRKLIKVYMTLKAIMKVKTQMKFLKIKMRPKTKINVKTQTKMTLKTGMK